MRRYVSYNKTESAIQHGIYLQNGASRSGMRHEERKKTSRNRNIIIDPSAKFEDKRGKSKEKRGRKVFSARL